VCRLVCVAHLLLGLLHVDKVPHDGFGQIFQLAQFDFQRLELFSLGDLFVRLGLDAVLQLESDLGRCVGTTVISRNSAPEANLENVKLLERYRESVFFSGSFHVCAKFQHGCQ